MTIDNRPRGPEEQCPLCHVLISTGNCTHLIDLGHNRVGMPRHVWEALIADRERLHRLAELAL